MMANGGPLCLRGLSAAYIETAVYLHRIGGNDFKDITGKAHGQVGLA